MKYFLDTEFLEGEQVKRLFGIPVGKTKPTIDLISIGIVAEDNREYYAVSKDFNLREAWDRYNIKIKGSFDAGQFKEKVYWIRENVLKPIFDELSLKQNAAAIKQNFIMGYGGKVAKTAFTYKNLQFLIKKYGKTNAEIANNIVEFIYGDTDNLMGLSPLGLARKYNVSDQSLCPEFYAYYADYDWVAFCWLFGLMIDLPKGFPMYCIDLKQELDRIQKTHCNVQRIGWNQIEDRGLETEDAFDIKLMKDYPKQEDEHSAIHDARWDFELFKFLEKL